MVIIDIIIRRSNAASVLIAFCVLILSTGCLSKQTNSPYGNTANTNAPDKNSVEKERGFFAIPQFDGAGQGFVIQEKKSDNEQKRISEGSKEGNEIPSTTKDVTAEQSETVLAPEIAAKCETVYNLSKREQLECLSYYQAADASLQSIQEQYDEQRFFPVPDELGTYQNLTSDNIEIKAPRREQILASSDITSAIVLNRANTELLSSIDLSTLESGVIVKHIPENKPLVVDFDEQNATIRLPNLTSPYVIISVNQWKSDDVVTITSLVNKTAIQPNIIALNAAGQAVAQIEEFTPEYQAETLIKYAKLNYTIPRMMLGDDVQYLLITASQRAHQIKVNITVEPSQYGRLIFRR